MNRYGDEIRQLIKEILFEKNWWSKHRKDFQQRCTKEAYANMEKYQHEQLIDLKRKLRSIYKRQEEDYQEDNKPFAERTFYPSDDYYCIHRYYNVVLEATTREEAADELWENFGTRIYSEYDCTGRLFTNWFSFARLPVAIAGQPNVWRVCESMSVDV